MLIVSNETLLESTVNEAEKKDDEKDECGHEWVSDQD